MGVSEPENPLLSPSPHAWQRLIEAVEPAALLLVIEQRLSPRLRAEHSAEDILQEALLHAWRGRANCEWRGLRSFRAWLLRIIDHRIHDLADRAGAEKRAGGAAVLPFSAFEVDGSSTTRGGPAIPAGSTTPSRLAIYREQKEAMAEALAGLPDELREVVRLRLFEQLPLEEVAARTGIGFSAVRHRFRKGSELYLRRLRTEFSSRSIQLDSATRPRRESSPGEEPPLP